MKASDLDGIESLSWLTSFVSARKTNTNVQENNEVDEILTRDDLFYLNNKHTHAHTHKRLILRIVLKKLRKVQKNWLNQNPLKKTDYFRKRKSETTRKVEPKKNKTSPEEKE